MEKKILLFAAALLAAVEAFALRPGDPVEELIGVNWVQGAPLAMLPPENPSPDDPEFKVVVFLLTRAQNTDDTLTLLNFLRRTFANRVRFAVVTPDSETDVKELLKRRPDFTASFGVDTKRTLTPKYIGSSLLLPLAFITDDEGEIVWSGEAAYLGEALQKCLDGTLDRDAQRKLSPLLDELPTLLRGDNESRMRRLVDSILRIEPGQPTALRIRLFVLESSGRADEALKLVQSQIKLAPQVTRLYFEAMNLIARNPQLASQNEAVVRAYTAAVKNDPDADNQMAWMLLNRQPDDPEALKSAKMLTARAKTLLKHDAQGALRGSCLNTRALLAYRLGKLEEAKTLQAEAVRVFQAADLPGAVADAQRRLRYFETVLSLAR
ncbi:hypothetical protein [uncultured Victivallis sp.]|uniref:tetratricopeptide repeat protein n=1 Tax=uncultured Victivallis sp. TaxID=354118 RepID=UPI0025E30A65|nr:hypothetical protein [uncultured Victivallis sp.]